jgi:phosphate transport system substrate-binding protein
MRRSFVRRGALFVAALALPVLAIGTAGAAVPSAAKLSSATLNADGSTFQLAFNQVVIGAFKPVQKSVTINYQGNGSGQGRTDFKNKTVDWAGTDAIYAAGTEPTDPFFYFPTVTAPITVSYNLSGVKGLKLSPETAAQIFSTKITTWDDPAIAADNPKLKLPSTTITVVHRTDGSGTTQNFTEWLSKAAPTDWTLGSAATVQWPAGTQGGSGNSGVANLVKTTDGAIGYVDFSDAKASSLTFAAIKNSSGKFIVPNLVGAQAAVNGATVNPDLTFDPINASGAKAYPITSPTWIIAYQTQSDANKGAALKAFLNFIYADGQKLAGSVDYARLPASILKQAKAQVKKLVVPAS